MSGQQNQQGSVSQPGNPSQGHNIIVYECDGRVRRYPNGRIEYLPHGRGGAGSGNVSPSVPAVYHREIAGQLIQQAAAHGQYVYPRAAGNGGPNDITSYHPAYRTIDIENRDTWPPILLQWAPTPADSARRDHEPPFWRLPDGHLVLNHQGRPMRDFAELPTIISSELEPGLLEVCRRSNMGIELDDLEDRCVVPNWRVRTVSEYARRFRDAHGIISFAGRSDPSTKRPWMIARAGPLRVGLNTIAAIPSLHLPALPRPDNQEMAAIRDNNRAPRTESWDWLNLDRGLYIAIAHRLRHDHGVTPPGLPDIPLFLQPPTSTATGTQPGGSEVGQGATRGGAGGAGGVRGARTSGRGSERDTTSSVTSEDSPTPEPPSRGRGKGFGGGPPGGFDGGFGRGSGREFGGGWGAGPGGSSAARPSGGGQGAQW